MNKVFRIVATLFLILLCPPLAADEGKEGHGGDPLVVDFYQRAQFLLSHLRFHKPLPWDLLDAFAAGFHDLQVSITDSELPNVGRVLPDPQRPGKFFVLLDRKKYLDSVEKRNNFDLGGFVAHEILETQKLDYNYAISRRIHFPEDRYTRWRARHNYPSISANRANRYGAIAYSFETGAIGTSWDFETPSEAEAQAMQHCSEPDCYVLSWVMNGCLAVSVSRTQTTRTGVRWASGRAKSQQDALAACESENRGESCRPLESVCTSYSSP